MVEHLTPYEYLKGIAHKCLQSEDKEKAQEHMNSFSDVFMGFCLTETINQEESKKIIPVIRSLKRHLAGFDKKKKSTINSKNP